MLSRFTLSIGIAVILIGEPAPAAPVPKTNQVLIVGVWEVTKSDDGTPAGTTLSFTRDGKLIVKTKVGDETLTINGTYKLKDDKLTVTIKTSDEETTDTLTITKLTEKELILKDEKGNSDHFKKKK